MSEWIKFSDRKPDENEHLQIWVSDGRKKRIAGVGGGFTDVWKYWLPIEEPELPKPQLHQCHGFDYQVSCNETQERKLVLIFSSESEYTSTVWPVKFCPFCGYSPISEHVNDAINYLCPKIRKNHD